MVQPEAGPSGALEADDYLCPLTTIRDTLLRPDAASEISIPKLRALLAWHKDQIARPWAPFSPPSADSKSTINKASFTLPRTSAQFTTDEVTRSTALKLSETVDIDEISAFTIVRSYLTFSVEEETDEDVILERALLWYAEEVLAAPQIALAVLKLSDDEGEMGQLAYDVRTETMSDPAKYIEGLFRAFSGLAQKDLGEKQRGPNALFWATHQLRLQETTLNLLFVMLYQTPARPAAISEGLIRGTIMSAFGTSQANREIWDTDAEGQRLSIRIRDLMVIIAVEALCLGQVVAPSDSIEESDNTLLQAKDKIASVHQFLVDYSGDLSPHYPEFEPGSVPLPIWPMPIICLAWAIVLRSMPQDKVPPGGEASVTWQDMTIRALRLPSGLFPWLETVLSGPLLESTRDVAPGDGAADVGLYHRKVFKDLLIGLSELVQLESIADRPGLYRSWELLFGGGSTSTSSLLAADYWVADFPYEERRSILDRSQYPHQPEHLLRVLSSLVGSSTSDSSAEVFGTDSAAQVHHYFTNLPTIAHPVEATWCRSLGKDESGREFVEALNSIVLPGGGIVPRGSRGLISTTGSLTKVMWINQIVSGWPLLLEILQAAAGLKSADEKPAANSTQPPEGVLLSVRDLDMQVDTADILAAGLKFLRATLHSSSYIKASILTHLSPDDHFTSGHSLLHLALTVLQHSRTSELNIESEVVSDAIDIIQALITAPSSNVWPALRSSGFFDVTGKKRGSVAALIQADSIKGEHVLTASVLRLVHTLVVNADHVPETDTVILRSALHLVFADVWNNFSAWRYKDVAKKYELSSVLVSIFDIVLSHPLTRDGSGPSTAAQVLIDLFITNTSPLTYRPLIDAITQAGYLIPRLIGSRRHTDAELVVKCLDESLEFIATLHRVSVMIGTPANALPKSLLAIPVSISSGDKIQLVDSLFDLAFAPAAQGSNILNILKTLRVYLEVIGSDSHRPSLASMLRSPQTTCEGLSALASRTDNLDIRAAVWELLSTIVSTQPGCVQACLGQIKEDTLEGILKSAVEEAFNWDVGFRDAPHTLGAVLNYLRAIMQAAGADKAIIILRKDATFWQSIFDLSTRIVAAPPSFALSMHSDDFSLRIQQYAYSVQAKANATALLASEMAYALENDDEDQAETQARTLLLSLFRNNSALQEAALMACHSSCVPELHEEQGKKITACGGHLHNLKTILLPSERQYGRTYLYDGTVIVQGSASQQSTVNLALDLLNLNWSMLDADIALTRSFRLLAESVASWTEGDDLAMNAALRAGNVIAEVVAEEYRGGDVMLAVQVDRLSILAVLLETSLDIEEQLTPDPELAGQLSASTSAIITSQAFPPIVSLRHHELPAIHQPVLRILYLLLQAMSVIQADSNNVSSRESLTDAGTIFALECADIVFDSIVRQQRLPFAGSLSMVVGVLCELAKLTSTTGNSVWLDKVQGVNLIGRSLEVLVRARVANEQVPLHLSSVLLLHLALASNPSSAEKLAVSGILPAYSDNAVIVEAEHGRIAPPSAPGNTVHDAWCSMLLVVKALLSTLPDTASFTRTDVIPFIRVCNAQMLRAMSWDGETPLASPALVEIELVVDVFNGVADALGPGSLADYPTHALDLLKSVRYALSHPRMLSTLFVPGSEEDKAILEAELDVLEGEKEVDLFDHSKTPALAGRATVLLRFTRTVILTLLGLTRSWETLKLKDDVDPEQAGRWILRSDEDGSSGSTDSDPVGLINDIYMLTLSIFERLPTVSAGATGLSDEAKDLRALTLQILESSSLLSFTQLLLRHSQLPVEEKAYDEESMDLDMTTSGIGKRRASSSNAGSHNISREGMVLRELEGDFRGMISGESGDMRGVLKGLAEKAFGGEA
ncbi:nuclear pore complex protein Nup188 [Kwoniella heveanensis BCC8398]|uniref:Nuclear pore complex protein Nup188 n=1 Tax=Kwoniella heveanensis BCC8398 TaxID=1296120 RepID=A0A1B9GXE7_9TREE|nr:nuclear pore complex protein Nup188 [Kwoniella heveanensis BCC8398]